MKKERIIAKVADLIPNEGQLGWLPKNPREWTRTDLDNLKASLERDPDFQEDRPPLVVACGDKLLVFAGNMRTAAATELGWDTIEAVLYAPENDEDHETIKRRAVLDNGSFGSWDYDALANEWDDLPLADWGVPAWNINPLDLSGMGIDPGSAPGESDTGYSEITFLFTREDADIVNAWIDENGKEKLIEKIVEICREAEAK